jgi:hypothetical protein
MQVWTGIRTQKMVFPGLVILLDVSRPNPPIFECVKEGLYLLLLTVFGSHGLRPNARSFIGWQFNTGCGEKIKERGMVYKTRLMPPFLVFKILIH